MLLLPKRKETYLRHVLDAAIAADICRAHPAAVPYTQNTAPDQCVESPCRIRGNCIAATTSRTNLFQTVAMWGARPRIYASLDQGTVDLASSEAYLSKALAYPISDGAQIGVRHPLRAHKVVAAAYRVSLCASVSRPRYGGLVLLRRALGAARSQAKSERS
jgi:hypothetical protein